jgi:hypothetical protein
VRAALAAQTYIRPDTTRPKVPHANQHRGEFWADRLELMEIPDFLGVDMRGGCILNNRVTLCLKSGDHLNHHPA